MRNFALLLCCISLSAYQIRTTGLPEISGPAAQSANILFQSADGGKTWQDMSQGLPENLRVNNAIAQGREVYLVSGNRIFHTNNPETAFWEEEFPTADFQDEESMNSIFAGRSTTFVHNNKYGLFMKTAGTNRWKRIDENLEDKNIHQVIERPDGTIFICNNSGVFKSADEGKSWKNVFDKWVVDMVATDDVIICNAWQGLMRSTDEGENWSCVLPDEGAFFNVSVIKNTENAAMHDQFAAVRIVGQSKTSETALRMCRSVDSGSSWQAIDDSLWQGQAVYSLQQAGEYLFCSHQHGISRSSDGGKTWEVVHSYTSKGNSKLFKLTVSGENIFAVLVQAGC